MIQRKGGKKWKNAPNVKILWNGKYAGAVIVAHHQIIAIGWDKEMSLSAISNETIYYSPEITDEFGKNNKFICIGCKGELIFHRNIAGVKIKHFAHKIICPFETEPETKEHIEVNYPRLKSWAFHRS